MVSTEEMTTRKEEMEAHAKSKIEGSLVREKRKDRKNLAKGRSPSEFVNDYYAKGHAPWYTPYVTTKNIILVSAAIILMRVVGGSFAGMESLL